MLSVSQTLALSGISTVLKWILEYRELPAVSFLHHFFVISVMYCICSVVIYFTAFDYIFLLAVTRTIQYDIFSSERSNSLT